jgi:hypothetical protein
VEFSGLQGQSPENGSFLEFDRRLLGILGPKSSIVGLQRLLAMRKGPQFADLSHPKKEILKKREWMAGDAVLIAPVS